MNTRTWRDDDAAIVEDGTELVFVDLDAGEAHVITPDEEQNIYSRGGWTDEVPAIVRERAAAIAASRSLASSASGVFNDDVERMRNTEEPQDEP